jgi:hypothetical protein
MSSSQRMKNRLIYYVDADKEALPASVNSVTLLNGQKWRSIVTMRTIDSYYAFATSMCNMQMKSEINLILGDHEISDENEAVGTAPEQRVISPIEEDKPGCFHKLYSSFLGLIYYVNAHIACKF